MCIEKHTQSEGERGGGVRSKLVCGHSPGVAGTIHTLSILDSSIELLYTVWLQTGIYHGMQCD